MRINASSMSSKDDSRTCGRCLQHFTHKSSLVRHAKRCYRNEKPIPRRKACQQCASSKARCDLRRPTCGRCQGRSTMCEFAKFVPGGEPAILQPLALPLDERLELPVRTRQPDTCEYPSVEREWLYRSASSSEMSSTTSSSAYPTKVPSLVTTPELDPPCHSEELHGPPGVWFDRALPSQRHRASLLGESTPARNEILTNRATHFMLRVLKSWPRMMAMHGPDLLPPLIHKFQLASGIPGPLANCYTLVNIWSAGAESSRDLVRESILQEIHRLLHEYPTYNTPNLLAALQSLLILLIILFFCLGDSPDLENPTDAQTLIEVWEVKNRLAATGLFLDPTGTSYSDWAIISAKHRTIHSLHHLDFVWSVLRGYPILLCWELGPLPAPPPRYLWEVGEEAAWKRMYARFLQQWADGPYLMSEMFAMNGNAPLGPRAERWLAEADEFGMMLMAEGTIALPERAPEGANPYITLDRGECRMID
ncbi:hypothetical protein BJY01DRAFT_100384 [Aspergillus pseudoustus]|uniref:Zn(2)-C6 fungal-type domain-containing protein n=1 Tax=Aspergillus pseudoustus TaxID=1810923 RepID=A0ABR4KIE5_9EURO